MNYVNITIKSYDKTVEEYENFTGKLHPKNEARIFLSLINKKSRILDLGCGTARDSCIFSSMGFEVHGIDLSKKMIAFARERCKGPKFKLMDIMKLKFKDDFFDAIWANASLLHIKKKEFPRVINGIRRILKNNGILYISVKEGVGEGIIQDNRYGAKKYWSYFNKKEMDLILKSCKFKILKSYITKYDDSMTMPWLIFFLRKE